MKDQRSDIIKKLTDVDNEDSAVESWEPCFQGEIHALVTLADYTLAMVESKSPRTVAERGERCFQVLGIEQATSCAVTVSP